jgi:Secretion system C-terminal sorting domain
LCIDRNTHDTLWTKSYPSQYNDYILQILETGDEGLVMIASTRTAVPNTNRLRLIKTDKSGNLVWEKFYSGFKWQSPWQSCIASDGNILLAYDAKGAGEFYYSGILMKINVNGQTLWIRKFNQSDSYAHPKVAQLQNGDIAFAWTVDTFSVFIYDFPPIIYILDSLGNIKTSHIIYSQSLRTIFALRVLPNGDLLGIGSADGPNATSFSTGGWLFRMSPDGQLLWERAISDKRYGIGEFMDAVATPDNGILATGNISAKNDINQIYTWVVKVDGNGCYESDCDSILLITPTGEITFPDRSYRLYPNPATDFFYIEGLTGTEERDFEIYNTLGQTVLSIPFPQANIVNVDQLPSGLYKVKITSKNNSFTILNLIKS